jgi:hypothetical protein
VRAPTCNKNCDTHFVRESRVLVNSTFPSYDFGLALTLDSVGS